MAVRVKLKYGPGLRPDQEHKLVHQAGFYIWSRMKGPDGWVIFAKDIERLDSLPKVKNLDTQHIGRPNLEVLHNGQLPDDVKDMLNKRIKAVIEFFVDPDAFQLQIKRRLELVARTLPKYQAKYVTDWIDENIELDIELPSTILKRSPST